jgi:hypothetical protein
MYANIWHMCVYVCQYIGVYVRYVQYISGCVCVYLWPLEICVPTYDYIYMLICMNVRTYEYTHTHAGIYIYVVELRLSELIGTASHPDMQEIRIIGFSLKIAYTEVLKLKKITNSCYRLHVYLCATKHYSGADRQLSELTRTL